MSIQPKVIALGFFDGVHLGHGALLRRTVEEARRRGVRSAVFTWAQPPKEVVIISLLKGTMMTSSMS